MDILYKTDLGFSDYLLLSIILILLHLINIIELVSSKSGEGDRIPNLKFQATTAFLGVISTILCGLVAQSLTNTWIDPALLACPLIFITVWFIHQPRSSNLINLDNVHSRVHIIVQNEIANYAEKNPSFTLRKLQNDYSAIITANILLRDLTPYAAKLNLPVSGLQELFKPLTFEKNEIEGILNNLCNKGELKYDNGVYRHTTQATFSRKPAVNNIQKSKFHF